MRERYYEAMALSTFRIQKEVLRNIPSYYFKPMPIQQCFNKCEAEPTCQSFDYYFNTNECYMSTHNHTNGVLRCIKNDVYIEINRKKEINGQTAYSTFSFKPNPYHNLVTEAQMDARSVLDCSHLFFSYKSIHTFEGL
ncbi:Hypothetical predicted protein [Octopus vulgaris]|uniref:Apple domain-containing protein n=1 Tax=Octopus vulgaris TaxID=6645 RepID=A0AA36FF28_OCTVU|nr:Hypothetical predicted protein [Octopus vulgaris]